MRNICLLLLVHLLCFLVAAHSLLHHLCLTIESFLNTSWSSSKTPDVNGDGDKRYFKERLQIWFYPPLFRLGRQRRPFNPPETLDVLPQVQADLLSARVRLPLQHAAQRVRHARPHPTGHALLRHLRPGVVSGGSVCVQDLLGVRECVQIANVPVEEWGRDKKQQSIHPGCQRGQEGNGMKGRS